MFFNSRVPFSADRIAAVDGLRALAVIGVFLYHAAPSFFDWGYLAIDVFFVMSGFTVTLLFLKQIQRNQLSVLTFFKNRILKIYFPMLVVCYLVLMTACLMLLPAQVKYLALSISKIVLLGSNVHFGAVGDYFDPLAYLNPMLHMWSLSIEEQFYLMFPIILFAVVGLANKFKLSKSEPMPGKSQDFRSNLFKISLGLIILCLACIFIFFGLEQKTTTYSSGFRFLQIMFGVLAALLQHLTASAISRFFDSTKRQWILALVMSASVVAWFYHINQYSAGQFQISVSLATAGLAFLFCFFSFLNQNAFFLLFQNSLFSRISFGSYFIYLCHWPLMSLYKIYFQSEQISWLFGLLLAVLLFVASQWVASYYESQFKPKVFRLSLLKIGILFVFLPAGLLLGVTQLIKNPDYFRYWAGLRGAEYVKLFNNADFDCEVNSVNQLCVLGLKTKKPQVLLIGDSVAFSMRNYFHEFALDANLAIELKVAQGCAPFHYSSNPRCQQLNQWLEKNIGQYQAVILLIGYSFHSEKDLLLEPYFEKLRQKIAAEVFIVEPLPMCSGMNELLHQYFVNRSDPETFTKAKAALAERCILQAEPALQKVKFLTHIQQFNEINILSDYQSAASASFPFPEGKFFYYDISHISDAAALEMAQVTMKVQNSSVKIMFKKIQDLAKGI